MQVLDLLRESAVDVVDAEAAGGGVAGLDNLE